MSPAKDIWWSFCFVLKKEIWRFLKVWGQTVFSPLVSAALYMLVFGVSLSRVIGEHQGYSYLEFIIPGLVAMGLLNNSLQNSASSIMISKFHNDLQDLRIIPQPPVGIAAAYALASLLRGFTVGLSVFALGQLFTWIRVGSFISVAHPLVLVLFMVMSSLFFGCVGIWAGFKSNSFDQINVITTFVVLPLIYLGGVFFSLEILHPFWQQVAQVNPLLYLINGIRWSVLGTADISIHVALLASGAFLVLSAFIAWWAVKFGSYQRF